MKHETHTLKQMYNFATIKNFLLDWSDELSCSRSGKSKWKNVPTSDTAYAYTNIVRLRYNLVFRNNVDLKDKNVLGKNTIIKSC